MIDDLNAKQKVLLLPTGPLPSLCDDRADCTDQHGGRPRHLRDPNHAGQSRTPIFEKNYSEYSQYAKVLARKNQHVQKIESDFEH